MNFAYKILNSFSSVEKPEVLPLLLLFFHSFLNGVSLIIFETTANTLFLMEYDTNNLPYVYIFSAIFSVVIGFFYSKLEQKSSVSSFLKIMILFILVIYTMFYLVIKFGESKLSFMMIMIFKDIVWMFAGMEFGLLIGYIFDIRQGKRLFGLLMSGEVIAGILGGLLASFLIDKEILNVTDLLLVAIFFCFSSYLLLTKILEKFKTNFIHIKNFEDSQTNQNTNYFSLLKNNYYLLFFALSFVAFFVFYLVDFIFYFKVEEKFQSEKELATFFALFFVALNIVNLFSTLFLSSRLFQKFGLSVGLIAIPILAIVGTSSVMLVFSFSLLFGFLILVVVKLLHEAFDSSLLTPAYRIIYQSIYKSQRGIVVNFRETVVEPIAMGCVGVLLIFLSSFNNIYITMFFVILLSILWLFLAKKLKAQYVISLNGFLKNRHILSDNLIPLNDIDINFFLNLLKSQKEIEVIYAIETISKMKYEKIEDILKEQINHESKKVRAVVLDCIDDMELYSFVSIIEQALKHEKDIDVLIKLIEIYCKFLKTQSVELIKNYLYHEDTTIQDGTIISMIKYSGIDGILIAGKILNDILNDQTKQSQIRGLSIVNKINMHGFYSAIKSALQSDNVEIKNIAIEIVGNLKIVQMIDYLIENISNHQYKKNCIHALIKFDISIFDTLVEHFKDSSIDKQMGIIKVFANIKHEKTSTFILNQIENRLLFDKILKSLFSANFHTDDKELILRLLTQNAKEIVIFMQLQKLIDDDFSNSKIVLDELLRDKMENIFYILSFIYRKDVINKLLFSYRNFLKDKKAYIVEIIDNLADNSFKPFIIDFIEDSLDDKNIYDLAKKSDILIDDYKLYIKDMLEKREFVDILAISLLYEIGKNRDLYFLDVVKKLKHDKNLLLKETSSWAYIKLKEKNNASNN